MKVLMITGDRRFGPGNERYELQKTAVQELEIVYWGKGSAGWRIWPEVPKGFDVVTVQDPFWRGLFGLIAARRIGARLNVQVHTDLSTNSFVRHVLSQIVLRHADSVRVVSEKIKGQVEEMGVRAKISILPVYIDVSRFREVVRQPHPVKTILWIGRFEEEKNPLAAIYALREVLKTVPDARLIMLGSGSLEDDLKAYAEGVSVEFPGWQSPVDFLGFADVVLCTSWHESFGASIIEALAAGVPVVSPDVGIAKEAGAIVVPRQDMAKKIVEILHTGERGNLKLKLLEREEWASAWKNTL